MSVALRILLIAFCLQALAKFLIWFVVPYRKRITRIAAYYRRDSRIISTYDTLTMLLGAALVVLLAFTGMQSLSFITGLVVGTVLIQIFFHRFNRPLTAEQTPQAPSRRDNLCPTPFKPVPAWPGLKSYS